MNRKIFYDSCRKHKEINWTQQNVVGMEKHLDYAEAHNWPIGELAYILATAYWETSGTMHPVKEAFWVKNAEAWRKRHLRYYPYYGRGLIQVTWDYNYKKVAKLLDLPENFFIKNPDKLMEWEYALPALFVGMKEGTYTGKDLGDYIDDIDESDDEDYREYKNARRIVNGTDRSDKIATLAIIFEHALRESNY